MRVNHNSEIRSVRERSDNESLENGVEDVAAAG